jgi:hypothetical protein
MRARFAANVLSLCLLLLCGIPAWSYWQLRPLPAAELAPDSRADLLRPWCDLRHALGQRTGCGWWPNYLVWSMPVPGRIKPQSGGHPAAVITPSAVGFDRTDFCISRLRRRHTPSSLHRFCNPARPSRPCCSLPRIARTARTLPPPAIGRPNGYDICVLRRLNSCKRSLLHRRDHSGPANEFPSSWIPATGTLFRF